MIPFTIFIFVMALWLAYALYEDAKPTHITDKDGKERIKPASRNAQILILVCLTLDVGMIIYWTHSIWLIQFVQLLSEEVSNMILVIVALFLLSAIDYGCALGLKLPTKFLAFCVFALNCVVAIKAPLLSLIILFILAVVFYVTLKNKKICITTCEIILLKAMLLITVVLSIFSISGIKANFFVWIAIIVLALGVNAATELIDWKKMSRELKEKIRKKR